MLALLFGFVLGLSLAAPPGPMNALIAKEASRRGWSAGIRVGVGAPVADVLWLLAMYLGVGLLFEGDSALRIAALFGGLVMGFFALTTWQERDPHAPERPATFLAGFVAALTNPYQAAWWLSGGYVFVQSQGLAAIPGFLLGIFGWVVLFAFLVAHGAQRWTWFASGVRVLSSALLAGFSVLLVLFAMGRVAL